MTRKLLHCLIPVIISPSNIIDGDSIRKIDIPLGLNVTVTKNLRLEGIDAPEMSEGEPGERAKERLREIIGFCQDTKVKLHGSDAFGRALVTLYCGDLNINDKLLKDKFVKKYKK